MCAVVLAVLYILLYHRAQPCCRAPGLRVSPTTPGVRSFQGYSRVPDGKVRGDGAALGLVGQLGPPMPQCSCP